MTGEPRNTAQERQAQTGRILFWRDPNPLLVRELIQAIRMPRISWTIGAIVALVGLGMLSFGSLEQAARKPASLGVVLFQVLTCILLLYVSLVGPATAAATIAAEREGRTLEPLLLTGLTARDIARGKFLATYATVSLQVIALLPLVAIPLLFGGVSASELLVAYVYILVTAAVAVGFGLALASRMQTIRGALTLTILLPAAGAPLVFALATFLGERVAKKAWPVLTGGPIWWTGAYATVPFGIDYLLWLVAWPLAVFGLALWLFASLTHTHLAGPTEDRSTAIKSWWVGTIGVVSVLLFLTDFRVARATASIVAYAQPTFLLALFLFAVFLFADEPLSPTRLVEHRWKTRGSGVAARLLGPGLMRSVFLQIACAAVALGACYAGGVLACSSSSSFLGRILIRGGAGAGATCAEPQALGMATIYVFMFTIFLLGVTATIRTRKSANTAAYARTWTLAIAAVAILVPLLLRAIVDPSAGSAAGRFILNASPLSVFDLFFESITIRTFKQPGGDTTPIAAGAALAWGIGGAVMIGLAWERGRHRLDAEAKRMRAVEERLEEEDDLEADDDGDSIEEALPPPPKM